MYEYKDDDRDDIKLKKINQQGFQGDDVFFFKSDIDFGSSIKRQ